MSKTTDWDESFDDTSPMVATVELENQLRQEDYSGVEDDYMVFLCDEYYLASTYMGVVIGE